MKFRLFLCFFLAIFVMGFSQETPENQPEEVLFGIYIDNVFDLNWHEDTVELTFWIWNTYSDPKFDPLKALSIQDVRSKNVLIDYSEQVNKETWWTNMKLHAKVFQSFNLISFPFIKETISLKFFNPEFGADSLKYVIDEKNSQINPNLEIDNWRVTNFTVKSMEKPLPSNFGNPNSIEGKMEEYSMVSVEIDLQRGGWKLFIQIFGVTYLAYLVSLCSFFSPTNDLQSKSGFMLGGIFGVVGNKLIIDSYLPWVDEITLFDSIQLATFIYLLIALAITVSTANYYERNPKLATRIDVIGGILSFFTYIVVNVLLIFPHLFEKMI